jgi:hypothetical protein
VQLLWSNMSPAAPLHQLAAGLRYGFVLCGMCCSGWMAAYAYTCCCKAASWAVLLLLEVCAAQAKGAPGWVRCIL